MTRLDTARIAALLAEGDQAKTSAGRGRPFEELIVCLFEHVPGTGPFERNRLNAFGAGEIDVAFWCDDVHGGLGPFGPEALAEGKNWTDPVGFPEVSIFFGKLRSRGRPFGLLFAANGITGDSASLTRAHSVIAEALREECRIVVVSRGEIEALTDTDDVVLMLKRKRLELVISGTVASDPES